MRKYIVGKWKNGNYPVRERATGEIIGSIIPYFQRAYMATSHTGDTRDKFPTQFDACIWLMQKHEQSKG
jgi:hypothetical protein